MIKQLKTASFIFINDDFAVTHVITTDLIHNSDVINWIVLKGNDTPIPSMTEIYWEPGKPTPLSRVLNVATRHDISLLQKCYYFPKDVLKFIDEHKITGLFFEFYSERLISYLNKNLRNYTVDVALESDPEAYGWYDILVTVKVECRSDDELFVRWREIIEEMYTILEKDYPQLFDKIEIVVEKLN